MEPSLQELAEAYASAPDEQRRATVVMSGVHLVRSVVGRTSVPNHPLASREDLESAGLIGLLQALDQYDPSRGTPFASFAYSRIRGSLIDYLRTIDPLSRDQRRRFGEVQHAYETLRQTMGQEPEEEDVADFIGITVDEYRDTLNRAQRRFALSIHSTIYDNSDTELYETLPSEDADEAFAQIEQDSLVAYIQTIINEQSEREQHMLALYYYEDLTLREIAGLYNLTEARISQILGKSLLKIRARLNQHELAMAA